MTKTPTDELFAAYTRTAPLEDLRFYIRIAERRLADFDLGACTIGIVAEMVTLERELQDVPGTPAIKRRVWALIDRYKASCPPLHVFARGVPPTRRADGSFCWVQHRVPWPQRRVTLTGNEVRALVVAALPEAPAVEAKPARVRKPVAPSAARIPCPSSTCAHGALVPETTFRLRCDTCQRMWELRDEQPKAKSAAPRAPRRAAPILDGEKTCQVCHAAQPLEQFAWGVGHTQRNTCRTCRNAQRAAMRRQAAAA